MTYSIDFTDTIVGFAVWHLGRVLGIVKVKRPNEGRTNK